MIHKANSSMFTVNDHKSIMDIFGKIILISDDDNSSPWYSIVLVLYLRTQRCYRDLPRSSSITCLNYSMYKLYIKFFLTMIDPSAGSPTETLLRLLLPLSITA